MERFFFLNVEILSLMSARISYNSHVFFKILNNEIDKKKN